jgi:hypothetical protein
MTSLVMFLAVYFRMEIDHTADEGAGLKSNQPSTGPHSLVSYDSTHAESGRRATTAGKSRSLGAYIASLLRVIRLYTLPQDRL